MATRDTRKPGMISFVLSDSDKKAVDGKIMFRWSTPYAKYLWNGDVMYGNPGSRTYGPEKISFTSALAREEWAKYAREEMLILMK